VPPGYPGTAAEIGETTKIGRYAGPVSDAIHSRLADIQASLTASCSAESPGGIVRAEASAKRQLALQLSPAAMRMRPDDLAALILTTQREAQSKAEAALTERLDTFRCDPRVAVALDNLRDTQASPPPPPRPATAADDEDHDADYIDSIYRRH
jgi:YbaB/EbfC DNA-binding family protein